ncbi:MAG: hypothetical protein ACXVR1_10995 [Solirubrobacteraceae bacterium]
MGAIVSLDLPVSFLDRPGQRFALNPVSPWNEVLAALFGVGAGLTLDEFALWVYLRDVYWAEEGRASFDAVVIATVLGGLVVLGLAPFDVQGNTSSVSTLCTAVAIAVLLSTVAILKGKPLLGLIGIFIPVASLVAAVRLASPGSWWARRVYGSGRKHGLSQARWSRIEARRRRIADAIAGTPTDELASTGRSGGSQPHPDRADRPSQEPTSGPQA